MLQGFKDFIMRGNVIELAVAVVIGGAFGAIVTALVDYLINPLIGAFVPSGNLESWVITFPGVFDDVNFGIGGIISAVINFLSIALVVYLVLVMPMNKLAERRAAKIQVEEEEEPAPTQEELLIQIRDLLAKQQA
ncbi:large conductance mechanosensitive channel protein MscL [Microbacterium petrolearium]|jgi:large conductance mechanosensitive channel